VADATRFDISTPKHYISKRWYRYIIDMSNAVVWARHDHSQASVYQERSLH